MNSDYFRKGFILLIIFVFGGVGFWCLYTGLFSKGKKGELLNTLDGASSTKLNNIAPVKESHNKEWMAIVKNAGIRTPSETSAEGFDDYNQIVLWKNEESEKKIVIDSSSIKVSEIIGLPEDFPRDNLTDLANPLFSLDDKRIYFSASAWTTSSAIFSFDIERNQISYLTHGEIKEVILEGENEGSLLVRQRKLGDESGVMYCDVIIDVNNGKKLKEIDDCKQ